MSLLIVTSIIIFVSLWKMDFCLDLIVRTANWLKDRPIRIATFALILFLLLTIPGVMKRGPLIPVGHCRGMRMRRVPSLRKDSNLNVTQTSGFLPESAEPQTTMQLSEW